MRRNSGLSALCLAAVLAVTACKPDEVIATPDIPTAGIRFINAVPDTSGAFGMDFRFVDLVENSSTFRAVFRNNIVTTGGVPASTLVQFRPARAGQRRFAIFLNDTLQSLASVKLKDSTLTLEAGKLYTAILWGNARGNAPAMRLSIIEENVADPGSNVAVRVINATSEPIDVRHYLANATAPATPAWANVAPLSVSSYVTMAPSTTAARYRFNIRAAGGSTALPGITTDPTGLIGNPASSTAGPAGKFDIPPTPGTDVAGSAISLIVFPRSVAGVPRIPQTAAFQANAASFVWDRRPPNCPDLQRGCTYQ
jgi:hypothetical protein